MEFAGAFARRMSAEGAEMAHASMESKDLEAFGWGFLSASSLVFGAIVGICKLPSKVSRAAMMAFGGGALIEALSIELFAHLIAIARGLHSGRRLSGGTGEVDRPLIYLAVASALGGGLLFAALDQMLNNHGAFIRKASTVKTYVGRLRYALMRRLLARLRQVPMFEVLNDQQLERLARSMVRERYSAGSVLFRELRSDSSIFFIVSGQVELEVTTVYSAHQQQLPPLPPQLQPPCETIPVPTATFPLPAPPVAAESQPSRPMSAASDEGLGTDDVVISMPNNSVRSAPVGSPSVGSALLSTVGCVPCIGLEAARMAPPVAKPRKSRSGPSKSPSRSASSKRTSSTSAPVSEPVAGNSKPTGSAAAAVPEPAAPLASALPPPPPDTIIQGQSAATLLRSPMEVIGEDQEVVDVFTLGPNDIFGEMSLFTSETVRAKATARSATCVLRIPSVSLHGLLASNRRLQDFVAMCAIDRLRETEVFRRCTPSTVARLVTFMKQAEFQAGDVLFFDVDAFCPVYFVVLGRVEVVRRGGALGDDQEERQVVCSNGLLGTEHLVHKCAMHATATALERTTVLIVQRADIDKLCERDERFRQAVLSAGSTGSLCLNGVDQTMAFEPPEGSAAPTRFGFEEMGWKRKSSTCSVSPETLAAMKDHDSGPCTDQLMPGAHSGNLGLRPRGRSLRGTKVAEGNEDDEDDCDDDRGEGYGGFTAADLPDLLANNTAAAQKDTISVDGSTAEPSPDGEKGGEQGEHGHGGHGGHGGRGVQAALTIWLGILIDGVPESVVMGILVNTATRGTLLAFVVGVFLANFPEAMSSAGTMRLHGMRRRVILAMWASIAIMTGIGAAVGASIFPPGSKEDPLVMKLIAGIEGLCGGAMLCMIANTVLPEAFEQGGNVTGLSTLLGFLVAISVSIAA